MIENILWELEPKKAGAGEKTGAGQKRTGSATLTVGMFFFERIKKFLNAALRIGHFIANPEKTFGTMLIRRI